MIRAHRPLLLKDGRTPSWRRTLAAVGATALTAGMVIAATPTAQAATAPVSQATAQAVNLNLLTGAVELGISDPATSASNDGTSSDAAVVGNPKASLLSGTGLLSAGALAETAAAHRDGSSYACAGVLSPGGTLEIGDSGTTCSSTGVGTGGITLDLADIDGVGSLLSGIASLKLTVDSIVSFAHADGITAAGDATIIGLTANVDLVGGLLSFDLPIHVPSTPNQNVLSALVAGLTSEGNPLLTPLVNLLTGTLAGVVDIKSNYQTTSPDGTFQVSGLHISLLDGSGAVADLAVVTVGPNSPVAGSTGKASRIAGDNRYETSAMVADRFGPADAVVIANGETYKQGVDALSANFLAGQVSAPILLTWADKVEPVTINAVRKILAGAANPTVYVMGKTDSVSASVVAAVRAAAAAVSTGSVSVVRVGGDNRYATSALAATQTGNASLTTLDATRGRAKTAILASGVVNADALAVGPLSNALGIPVLLASDSALDHTVAAAIKKLGIEQLLVLGATDRIPQAVLHATGIDADRIVRIAGTNRFKTSAMLYTFAVTTMGYHDGDRTDTYLANGYEGFPDALTVGPLAGKTQSALLTVGSGSGLDPLVETYLRDHGTGVVTALGLTDRITAAQLNAAARIAAK